MVLARADAEDAGAAAVMRGARLIYLAGSSPMHLRSVLKNSKVWDALLEAWHDGAVVAGSSGAAMALTDPMVDARGGGLTIGLGLLTGLAVVPHFGDVHEDEHGEKLHRSVHLAPAGTPVAGIPERTALIRDPDGTLALGRRRGGGGLPGRRPGRVRARRPAGLSPAEGLGGPPGRERWLSPLPMMVTDSMVTFSDGAPERLPTDSMAWTTSRPLDHLPEQRVAGRQGARRRAR